MATSSAVRAFRARFAGLVDASRGDDRAEDRLSESLRLHGLALVMDIERARRDLPEGASDEEILALANERRRASSPIPPSPRERLLARSNDS